MAPTRLLKLPQVCDLSAIRTTALYGAVKAGLYTPPIKVTPRSSAWPENEVAAINAARIAGRSDQEIRELVAQLVAQRQQPPRAA